MLHTVSHMLGLCGESHPSLFTIIAALPLFIMQTKFVKNKAYELLCLCRNIRRKDT